MFLGYLLGLSAVSAFLYRVGGASKEEIPFANSQYRDWGCPTILFLCLLLMFPGWHWQVWLASLSVLGFIRTYHDYTGADNMYLHGLFIGLSLIPLHWLGVTMISLIFYSLVLSLTMGALNTFCTRVRVPRSVWIEEFYRGFIIIAALPLLRIGA